MKSELKRITDKFNLTSQEINDLRGFDKDCFLLYEQARDNNGTHQQAKNAPFAVL